MKMTHAWCDVLVAFGRSFVLVGALFIAATLLAAPAHAQSKFKVTDGTGVSLDATLSQDRRTLTLKGPKGTFVFTYNQEYTTQSHFGYGTNKGEIQMLRWPRSGRGQLIAYIESNDERVPSQWRAIGNVQPLATPKPKPKPTPKPTPKPPTDRFPKRSWRAHNATILDLDFDLGGGSLVSGDARGVTKRWNLTRTAGQGYAAQGSWNRQGRGVAFRGRKNVAMGGSNVAAILRANGVVQLTHLPQRIESVAYRWDGEWLALGGIHPHSQTKRPVGTIRLYHDDGNNVFPLRLLQLQDSAVVRSIAFGPGNRYLYAAGGAGDNESLGTVTRWDLATNQSVRVARFRGVAYSVAAAGTAAQGGFAFAGARIEGGRKVGFITLVTANDTKSEVVAAPVKSLDLCRDGTKLAAGTGNSVLLFTKSSNETITLPTSGRVRSVAISKDGSKIAAGDTSGVITVWNIGARRPVPPTVAVNRLKIRVVDSQTKRPITRARVAGKAVGAGGCNKIAWFLAQGVHRFETSQPGQYMFDVSHQGYKPQTLSTNVNARERVETILLVRDVAAPKPTPKPTPAGAIVLLKVQHADGSIVPNPTIQFTGGPGKETPDGAAAGGALRYKVSKPGNYQVLVSKDGYLSQTVAVRADGKPQAVTLHRMFTLLLTVLDADKQPVAQPRIVISGPGKETKLASSGAIHSYALTSNGLYKVTVSKAGFKQQTLNVDVRKRYTGKTITLPREPELAIEVLDSNRKAIAKPTIKISGPGKESKRGSSGAVHTYALTANGVYTVTVSKDGFETQTKKLGAGKSTFVLRAVEYELVVRIPEGGDVAVYAPKGEDVTRRVDAAYSLWLSPGTYKASYTNAEKFTFEKEVTIKSGNAELRFERDPFPQARRFHREMDSNKDGKLTDKDVASGWDQIRKAIDRNGDGELTVEEIAAQFKAVGQEKDDLSTKTPLPARSRPDALRRKLDSLPGTEAGWAKKDLDPKTWEFFKDLDSNGDEVIDTTEQKRFTDAVEKESIADTVKDPDATTVPTALVSLRNRLRKLDKKGDGLGRTDVTPDAWLWLFRNFDKNKNDKLDAPEELAFLLEFQSVARDHLKGKALIEVLRPLFRKRDKDSNGVDDSEVDTQEWTVLATYDTAPKNGRIDRNAEETRFLKDYEIKMIELLQLLLEADVKPPTPPRQDKAALLRARLKQYDHNNDGLDTKDVPEDVWTTLFAKYDTNNNGRLDPTELTALVDEWKKWVEEDPVDGSGQADAPKRRVLKIRKIGSR